MLFSDSSASRSDLKEKCAQSLRHCSVLFSGWQCCFGKRSSHGSGEGSCHQRQDLSLCSLIPLPVVVSGLCFMFVAEMRLLSFCSRGLLPRLPTTVFSSPSWAISPNRLFFLKAPFPMVLITPTEKQLTQSWFFFFDFELLCAAQVGLDLGSASAPEC